MSRENVEVVRAIFDAAARGDTEAVLRAYDLQVEYDFSGSALETFIDSVYRGHGGMREWVRDRHQVWKAVEDECHELIDLGEQVISCVSIRGRGRISGAEVEMLLFGLWTLQAGKVLRVRWFDTREAALEAAASA